VFRYFQTLKRYFRPRRQSHTAYNILIVILITCIFSCESTHQDKNTGNSNQPDKWVEIDTPAIFSDPPSNNLPTELFLIRRNLQEDHEKIIQIFKDDNSPPRKLVAEYKIGRDLQIKNGDIEWILISKRWSSENYNTFLRFHFIGSTDSDKVKAYYHFDINDNHLFKNSSLVSAFNISYNDSNFGLRNFIAVISKSDSKYYNQIFEINCFEGEECSIHELSFCTSSPFAKNQAEFKEQFPMCMSERQPADTSKVKYSDSRTRHLKNKPNFESLIYYLDSIKHHSVHKLFNGLSLDIDSGTYVFQSLNEFYTIGREIKTDLYFENVFFRTINQAPQICFTRSYSGVSSADDHISHINKFDLPKKTTTKSVFGYTCKKNDGYMTNYLVVISEKKNGETVTSLFSEFHTNRYFFMYREAFSNHKKLFKDVKTYEDFIRTFPKVMEEH